jgi:Domain of unknown function (DUF1906)/Calx-beta domain/RTX calcium-binding nonapeptide repeat (4 copies)
MATTYTITPASTTINESAGTVTFTVTRSGTLPAETLFVSTETGEGSANNGDYTGKLNEQLAFTSGQTSKTVTVSITNDSVVESSETFGLLVQRNSSDPATTFLAKSTFTIADDDTAATTYSISPGSTTVNESAGTVTFTVTRSGGTPAETLFVSTETGEGSANNGDYTGKLNEQLAFTSGQTSKTVTVSITNDSVAESSETFGLLVQRNSGDPASTFLAKSTFTIADDDTAATTTYSISPSSTTVNENAGTVTFTVTRSGATPAETLFVSTETGEGSANNGDYTGKLNEQLAFTSGQTSKTVTVAITNDSVAESSETFGLLVQRNSGDPASTFLAKSTFTIADDDTAATTSYSIAPGSTTVNENAGSVTFTVTRSGPTPAETLFVSTETGEGSANNGDYTGKLNEQLAFASGETSKTVTVSITNDSVAESSETFGLLVQRNSNDPATTFLAKSTFTIADDDTAATTYSLSPGSTTVNENAGTVTFTVTRSGATPAETLFVSTETGEGSANNADYTGKLNEQLAFTSGQTSKTVTVAITNDSVAENSETFGLLVQRNSSDPASTFLAKSTFTIADDDSAGTIYSVSPSPNPVNENAGTETFTITRSGSLQAETVFASTLQGASNGYDANSSDYNGLVNQQVSFAANQTSAQVTISIINNTTPEPDESFGFIVQRNSSDPVATFLAKTSWTIHDDDAVGNGYSVSATPNPLNENAGTATFTITRSGSNLAAETLFASTLQGASNGYAANSGDYTGLLNQQVSFAANQTSAQVTVSITNDTVAESDDTFGFIVQRNASDPAATYLAKTNWTIHDDDGGTPTNYSVTPSSNVTNENAGAVTFTVTRSGGLAAETLYVSTLNGAANGYSANVNDYNGVVNQPLVFAANQTTAQVTISVDNDTTAENDETFGFIVQHNASDSVATYVAQTNWTIHDDDAGPVVNYSAVATPNPLNESAGTVTFTITRSGSFPAETVFASTVQGSANGYSANSGDYATNVNNLAVAFASGQATATVTVAVTNDSTPESDETFGFIVQRNSGDPISTHLAQTNFTIHDDDNAATGSTGSTHASSIKLPFSVQAGSIAINQDFGEGARNPQGGNDHGSTKNQTDIDLYYAIDFGLGKGTAVLAQASGTVVDFRDDIPDAPDISSSDTNHPHALDPTNNPSNMGPHNFGNYLTVHYDDGTPGGVYATYLHLAQNSVTNAGLALTGAKSKVFTGEAIGNVGHTGAETGFHLHVTYGKTLDDLYSDVEVANGSLAANGSIAPVTFNVGSLHDGQTITSDNDFGAAVPSITTQPQVLVGSGANSVVTINGTTTPQQGIDYRHSEGAALSPADIKTVNQQYPNEYIGPTKFVIEYIGVTDGQGYLRPSEADQLKDAGFQIVSVFEKSGMSDTDSNGNYTNVWVQYFVPGQGAADAERAIAAAQKAGQQSGAIYFAIDLNPGEARSGISESAGLAKIAEYFEEIRTYFAQDGSPYDIGVYGAGDTLAKVSGDPSVNAKYTWLAGAPGWTDSSPGSTLAGHSTYTNWTIKQYDNGVTQVGNVAVDLDQTKGTLFGQWVPDDQSGSGTHLLLSAQGDNAVVSDTDTGKDLYQFSRFGEVAFNGVSNVTVKALNGTDIAIGTVFFSGTDSDDRLDASAADKDIVAAGGNGDDVLIGGLADDVLNGGAGNNTLNGGPGTDTADYSGAPSAVTVNLTIGTAANGFGGTDTLSNIESVIGSSFNDFLTGGPGNDILTGGPGNDRLIGGADNDIAMYSAAVGTYTLLSYNGTLAVLTHGADGYDRLQGIETLQFSDTATAASAAAAFDPWEYLASYGDLIQAIGANPQAGFDHYVDSGFGEGRSTNLFDAVEYIASNPDLIQAFGLNPLAGEQHYVTSGFNEHRATNSFDATEYIASNPDLIQAFGLNPLAGEQHYITSGFKEHRVTNLFDPVEYIASNADLIQAFGLNPLAGEQHYVASGFNEHRATSSFDPVEYLASNTDLIQAFGLNLAVARQHYIVNGFNEHRATASFDPIEYIASNTDLITAFGFNGLAGEQHYVVNGFKEHRPTTSFDATEYIASNADLIAAFGLNPLAGEQHYITSGFKDHRPTTSFDATEYIASNVDLIQAYGLNLLAGEQHYVGSGFNEHRPTNSFDAIEYIASNTDLITAFGLNPLGGEQHYIVNGFNEHRPTHSFDATEYIASNPDLITAFGLNGLAGEQHYIVNGFKEHRPTTSFDATEYLASNTDLIQAFGLNPLAGEKHYITNGFNEHRATSSFDPIEYIASNPDLITTYGFNALAGEQHYVGSGFNEHRPTSSFDALEYLASNADLIQAFGLNLAVGRQHYIVNGFNEHRPTASFDAIEYIASNPDLIQAFGANAVAGEQHYIVNGFGEHRATSSFDAAQYLANYADLSAAFGNDLAAAERHYITNGFSEGRTDKAPVVTGDAGNNSLVAKNGAIMTGGGGADNFVFNVLLSKPATITDFAAGTDHLQISASGFGHGLVAGGTAPLVTAATAAGASHAGSDGYFIFDNTGTVWWDPSGGSGADATALAKLTGIAALHASDFLLA